MMKTVFGEDSSIAMQSNMLSEVATTSQNTSTSQNTWLYTTDPQPMEVDTCHLDAPEPEETTNYKIPPGSVFCDTCNVWSNSADNQSFGTPFRKKAQRPPACKCQLQGNA